MHTEHLHRTLSPQAHADLLDALRRRAERERRLAVQHFGTGWAAQAARSVRGLAWRLSRAASVAHSARA